MRLLIGLVLLSMDLLFTPSSLLTPSAMAIPCSACTIPGQVCNTSTGSCECPPDYGVINVGVSMQECRPLPSLSGPMELGRTGEFNYYPACGKGRIPVNTSYQTPESASYTYPNTNKVQTIGSNQYPFAVVVSGQPRYLYRDYDRCACTWKNYGVSDPAPNLGSTALPALTNNNKTRIVPDHHGAISQQNSSNDIPYAPVAIHLKPTANGRLGTEYLNGRSSCGCPNFNEEMKSTDPGTGEITGAICKPIVQSSIMSGKEYRILTEFKHTVHDISGESQVINRSSEPALSNNLIRQIMLPSDASGAGLTAYKRRIWTCASPTRLDTGTRSCVYPPALHACNAGGNGAVASPVSNRITGSSPSLQFENARNKKLSCCTTETNSFEKADLIKFDCIENPLSKYANFDELWSSGDDSVDGGQMNAITLTDLKGEPITGFYTLHGEKCSQFSEFAGPIPTGKVNPLNVGTNSNKANNSNTAYAFQADGQSIPLPGSGAGAASGSYQSLQSAIIAKGKRIPGSNGKPEERAQCPILVRAAIVTDCGADDAAPPVRQTKFVDNSGASPKTRCSFAKGGIQVHLNIRQVWEVAGIPRMVPIDTVLDPKRAPTISVNSIMSKKHGTACPPGWIFQNNQCSAP